MTPAQDQAAALMLAIAEAEIAYDARVAAYRALTGRGRVGKTTALRIRDMADAMEDEADALRDMRTRLETLQRQADRQARRAVAQAERDRQLVLL